MPIHLINSEQIGIREQFYDDPKSYVQSYIGRFEPCQQGLAFLMISVTTTTVFLHK